MVRINQPGKRAIATARSNAPTPCRRTRHTISHGTCENQPGRTPRQREIHVAEVIRINRRIVVKWAICCQERRFTLERRKAQTEVFSKTVGDPVRAEHSKFVVFPVEKTMRPSVWRARSLKKVRRPTRRIPHIQKRVHHQSERQKPGSRGRNSEKANYFLKSSAPFLSAYA